MGSPRCLICGRPAPEGRDTHATLNDCIQALGDALFKATQELEKQIKQNKKLRTEISNKKDTIQYWKDVAEEYHRMGGI